MHDLQWYDFIRIAISCMAAFVLFRMVRRYRVRGETWSPRLMDIAWVIFCFLFLTIYGSMEQVLQNVEFGSRMFLTFLVVLLSIRATRWSDEPLQKF